MGVSQIIHFCRIFHYKPSILGIPHEWKPSNSQVGGCIVSSISLRLRIRITILNGGCNQETSHHAGPTYCTLLPNMFKTSTLNIVNFDSSSSPTHCLVYPMIVAMNLPRETSVFRHTMLLLFAICMGTLRVEVSSDVSPGISKVACSFLHQTRPAVMLAYLACESLTPGVLFFGPPKNRQFCRWIPTLRKNDKNKLD